MEKDMLKQRQCMIESHENEEVYLQFGTSYFQE